MSSRELRWNLRSIWLHRAYGITVAAILLIAGIAKVWSGLGDAIALEVRDPIFGIEFRYLMLVIGAIEMAIVCVCVVFRKTRVPLVVLAWFSTCLLCYRIGLHWLGWKEPCRCLGTLTDALHVSPRLADKAMVYILIYLLIGSYGLLWVRLRHSSMMHASWPQDI